MLLTQVHVTLCNNTSVSAIMSLHKRQQKSLMMNYKHNAYSFKHFLYLLLFFYVKSKSLYLTGFAIIGLTNIWGCEILCCGYTLTQQDDQQPHQRPTMYSSSTAPSVVTTKKLPILSDVRGGQISSHGKHKTLSPTIFLSLCLFVGSGLF